MKKLRECLPSKEREMYVQESIERGVTTITARLKNRYIDEFLRVVGHTNVNNLTTQDVRQYASDVKSSIGLPRSWHPDKKANAPIKVTTATVKVQTVLSWLRWMHENGLIKTDPSTGLVASELVNRS